MKIKALDVLLNGRHIGVLREEPTGRHTFTYDLGGSDTTTLSLSMPRKAEPWEGDPIEAYIDGILPDDPAIRQRIGRLYGVNPRNPFALLTAVGLDCGGGVQFVAPDADIPDGRITPISEERIGQRLLAIAGPQQASWQSGEEHWSLNGAQDKLALRYTNGQWYEVEGTSATTHIIKPSIRGLREQAFNEYLCLKTAEKLALPVARTDYRVFGGVPAVVSERWDRIVDDTVVPATVTRIHQEDFCQAMSVMTDKKYQSDGGPGAVDIVRYMSDNRFPEEDAHTFIKALIFNYLIGGSDAHAKNYAILEPPSGGVPRLAPLYDIASLFAYDTRRRERKLAMSIGGEYQWERIGLRHWTRFFEQCSSDPTDQERFTGMLAELAIRIVPSFVQASTEASAWASVLPDVTEEDIADKKTLINRMGTSIVEQSSRVLGWFAD
ncbi:type II toxin-antitoxin system HipA family toxin [Bifidobacterium sp. UTBIF-78]|uniref:type II toxin-antitoxin system HipA family toxin n=1 Tax=Bifidobacterium sp. UTBIF-78 TaxID=1465263 RepID=UPI00112B36F0|nr:type II toxin-antitoxin system HipA family toxin [Bifidobacterium sp. UTBIF-78]TPF93371.1 transcriptional regulator [Bifidobacterium sp. UTBIF-78]